MFGKKKQERPSVAEAGVTVAPEAVEQIHTMPERFYLVPKRGANRAFIIFGSLVIVVGVLVVFALAVWKFGPKPGGPAAPSAATSAAAITPPPSPIPSPAPTPATPEPSPSPAPTVEPSPVPSPEPSGTPAPSPVSAGSSDQDHDGLTLNEERLYGTSPENGDSDSDGYNDGSEVMNGYSPRVAGKTLVEDGLFQPESSSLPYGFSWAFPDSWVSQPSLAGSVATVQLDSRLGEQITAARHPASELPALRAQWGNVATQAVAISGMPAVRVASTPSRYYFTSPDQAAVMVLAYDAPLGQPSLAATFEAIVKSFRWVP